MIKDESESADIWTVERHYASGVCEVPDVNDTNEMITKMNKLYPGLEKMKYLVAVEKEIVQGNTPLQDNFTVALLPPYSGG